MHYIAARLEGMADPDTLVISPATFQLIDGYFDCKSIGLQTLKGISHPLEIYRVLKKIDAIRRLEASMAKGMTPMIGRDKEVDLLFDRWVKVKKGSGHFEERGAQELSGISDQINLYLAKRKKKESGF